MLKQHVTRCLIAGFVALLPVGGLVLTVAYLESAIASTWLADQPFYFPGLGLLAAVLGLYVIGLVVTTFIGRFLWSKTDKLLSSLPAVGSLYATLKQILGYETGEGAIFREVVLVPNPQTGGDQLGLVTRRFGEGADARAVVFVPGAPNPTGGQLVFFTPQQLAPVDLPVDEALKALVSLGKTHLDLNDTVR